MLWKNKEQKFKIGSVYYITLCVALFIHSDIRMCFPYFHMRKKIRETLCVIATNFENQLIEGISKRYLEEVIEGLVFPNDI